MGQIQKAMDVYEKAMEIAPDNDEAKQGTRTVPVPYPTLPYRTLPYPTLPYRTGTVPFPTLPHRTVPYRAALLMIADWGWLIEFSFCVESMNIWKANKKCAIVLLIMCQEESRMLVF
jgi:hypothetical protein